jgi:excisionase family DNA binding protein
VKPRTSTDFMQTTAVARRLWLSTERVRQLANEGALRAIRTTGGARLFRSTDVEDFARRRRVARG